MNMLRLNDNVTPNMSCFQSRVRGSKSEHNFGDVLNTAPSNADAASAPTTPSLEEKVPLWTLHAATVAWMNSCHINY